MSPNKENTLPKHYVVIRSVGRKTKFNLGRQHWSRIVKRFQGEHGRGAPSQLEKNLLLQQLHEELKKAHQNKDLPKPVLVQQVATIESAMEEYNGAFYQRVEEATAGKDLISAFIQANHNFKTFLAPFDLSTLIETQIAADRLEQMHPERSKQAKEFKATVCRLYGILGMDNFFRDKLEHEFVRIINKMWDELSPKKSCKAGKRTHFPKPDAAPVPSQSSDVRGPDDSGEGRMALKKPKLCHHKRTVKPMPAPKSAASEPCPELCTSPTSTTTFQAVSNEESTVAANLLTMQDMNKDAKIKVVDRYMACDHCLSSNDHRHENAAFQEGIDKSPTMDQAIGKETTTLKWDMKTNAHAMVPVAPVSACCCGMCGPDGVLPVRNHSRYGVDEVRETKQYD